MPMVSPKSKTFDTISLPRKADVETLRRHYASYTYQPLRDPSSKEIRLIELLPSANSSDIPAIQVRTSTSVDGQVEPYEAISYVWGSEHKPCPVRCGEVVVWVTRSLYTALARFRRPDSLRLLWADAICINQGDVEEKNWQVGQMKDVYRNALRVLVYLGEPDDKNTRFQESVPPSWGLWTPKKFGQEIKTVQETIDSLLEAKKRMDAAGAQPQFLATLSREQRKEYGLPNMLNISVHNSLWELQHRDWFSRVWVVQELFLANEALVIYGGWEIGWDDLETAIEFAENIGIGAAAAFSTSELGNLGHMCRARKAWLTNPHDKSLLRLLWDHRLARATDPRDHFYGLLALASDGDGIEIDYSKSVAQVFQECTRFCFRQALVDHPMSIASVGAQLDTTHHSVPSWVPVWGTIAESLPLFYPRQTRAAGDSKPDATAFGGGGETLDVSGYELDTVVATSCANHPYPFDPQITMILQVQLTSVLIEWADFVKYHSEEIYQLTGEPLGQVFWQLLAVEKSNTPIDTTRSEIQKMETNFRVMRVSRKLIKPFYGWPAPWWIVFAVHVPQMIPIAVYRLMRQSAMAEDTELLFKFTTRSLGRRIFKTAKGYLGLGPSSTARGDKVFLIKGGLTPFILRQGPESGRHVLVGESYLHGVMEGSAWDSERCYDIHVV